jgi:cell wall-associated NlpC family hydrolase
MRPASCSGPTARSGWRSRAPPTTSAAPGAPVARADLLPGDVVCFDDGTGYLGHVGLYAGDDRFLHAPHTGAVIGYDALTEPYYSARFAGGRRVTS